jgi:hypothetical protein
MGFNWTFKGLISMLIQHADGGGVGKYQYMITHILSV